MSQFSKDNFCRIIQEIENMEQTSQNIWVPIGILERMYDDDIGYIDFYFHHKDLRDVDELFNKLTK